MYCQMGNFWYFSGLFDTLAIKAMAFCEILLSSHQNLPFLKCVKVVNNLIPPSNCLHLSIYNLGTLGVKYTIFMQNALVNKFINMGIVPCYMYTRCSMLVQYQIIHISCLYTNTHSVYIVCLIEAYSMLKFTKFT